MAFNGYWGLGVVKESGKRKEWFKLKPEKGCRDLPKSHPPLQRHLLKDRPRKMPVSLDYEGGHVSFHNVVI